MVIVAGWWPAGDRAAVTLQGRGVFHGARGGKDARVEQAAHDKDGERAAPDGASRLSETSRSRPNASSTATHAGAKPATSEVALCRSRRATSALLHAK